MRAKEDMFRSNASTTTNPEVDRLFRESLQMQVELKFANDELSRLRRLEEALDNEKWRADKEHRERTELEQNFERVEKELMKKNRALLIEGERSKVLEEQINEQMAAAGHYKEESERQSAIIFSLEGELGQYRNSQAQQEEEAKALRGENQALRSELQQSSAAKEEVRHLQQVNRELEARNN
jgi:hypothetical protein